MKIAFLIVGTLDVRGGIKRICEYATQLAKRGHQVDILCKQVEHPHWLPERYYGGFNLVSFKGYGQAKYDVAIATGGRAANKLGRMDGAKLKIYSVVMQESLNKPTEKHGKVIDRDKWLSDPFNQNWVYIANSTWLKELTENKFGQKCHLIHNGVNNDRLRPIQVPKKGKLNLLAYGRSDGWKGGARSAQAAELVSKTVEGVHLVSYGQSKGPITFLPMTFHKQPHQGKFAEVYCSADMFLQSSRFEGFCNTAFESMACGVPVVSTDCVGIEDFCIHEETALLVPIDDIEAMAQSVIRLHKDKELYDHIRNNALSKCGEFQWDIEMQKLEHVFATELEARYG